MSALWTSAGAAAATGGTAVGDWCTGGIAIDSRAVAPGDLFVALQGPNHDAHAFVEAAMSAGAAAAMVRHGAVGGELPRLEVDDTLAGLEALGIAGRARARARVAGVTGSVGKTGTKEALRHVLARQGSVFASAASHNNHWGVPLSLARLPPATDWAVLEMGMNHAGELAVLTRQVRPQVALVTTVAAAHLEFFGSIDAIADAKGEIFEGLEPGGVAVLNRDDGVFERLLTKARDCGAARILTFGLDAGADFRLIDARLDGIGSEVEADLAGRRLSYRVGIAGRHWLCNSLAVLATVAGLGADVTAAAESLRDLEPPAGRGARYRVPVGEGEVTLLDESYNANPASVRAALDVLGRLPGRRVAVLGDMRELGAEGPGLHAGLADAVAAAGVARLYTCGPLMERLHASVPAVVRAAHVEDSAALLPLVLAGLREDDVVLVKGSLGSRMGPIAEALRRGAPGGGRRAG
ncbi:MAG TPA: UDP-N-acetylmuramoylalanyl-D-glutamyl-2,6-diaminopimelate--D-alanyl-D-alanine ligase [Geminicoccaceae bacterium]|nr:UDP-N-acetylmuramoylalanyl-D-glutamyl-2,6-diaminopimelate--D-alanyl-D-alanine ligase [Geminicoccus sp.]HMU50209.1 UDP-N-acetylmuramoylalanyl-D-glutamyl-2,6-diaminopimelate--D-alanyl-D-alanine ligase [Geminicoccaceae bacterium]